jgi:hypothetical protein
MLPAITTTHAIPRQLPSGYTLRKDTSVRCSYCLEVLGQSSNAKMREAMQASHTCAVKRLAKKPAASVPYN